jgi:glycosyltransferase involved in cell wall biosynthesis
MNAYSLCAVVPVYNHGEGAGRIVRALTAIGLTCIVVDDGSRPRCAALIEDLAAQNLAVVLRRPHNGGKGRAVQDGLRKAAALGYTHALQIDADGQHVAGDVPEFMRVSRLHPAALVGASPAYAGDAPRLRVNGRWLTRVWVWINTLSTSIPDAMCGFRIYPLAATLALLDRVDPGSRMEFDIAVLVRLYWDGVPMRWLPSHVRYPQDNESNFRMLRDNLLISRTHAVLFLGMLWRAPRLLYRVYMRRLSESNTP